MQITNGTVTFGRSIRPADFESKKAEFTLAFVVEENETADSAIAAAGHMAQQHVLSLLAKPERVGVPLTVGEETAIQARASELIDAEKKRRTVAVDVGEELIQGMTNALASAQIDAPVTKEEVAAATAPVVEEFDPLADDEPAPAPREVSDSELSSFVNRAAAEWRIPGAKIREIRDRYVEKAGMGVITMAAAKRVAFMAELEAERL